MLFAAALASAAARAEVWGYVDDTGHAHLAASRLDERYQLFFKGELPGESAPAAKPAEQSAAAPASVAEAAPTSTPPIVRRFVSEGNASRYEKLIEQHAARHDVDPALVKAIVAAESAFEPGAISPKGARGLMQVMPQTAARYGVTGDRKRSAEQKLLDPALNLQIGTRYLRDLLARFADNIALAVAAYNAGEMAVQRHHNRVPPYPETVEYVKRVQQLYAAFRPAPAPAAAQAPAQVAAVAQPVRRLRGSFLPRPESVAEASAQPPLL